VFSRGNAVERGAGGFGLLGAGISPAAEDTVAEDGQYLGWGVGPGVRRRGDVSCVPEFIPSRFCPGIVSSCTNSAAR
jgi:hypothetical protein